MLEQVQHDLFDLGGELSIPGHSLLKEQQVENLERSLEEWNSHASAAQRVHPPGGSHAARRGASRAHGCRRAERALVALAARAVGDPARLYLNRLSDLLFVAAPRISIAAPEAPTSMAAQRETLKPEK